MWHIKWRPTFIILNDLKATLYHPLWVDKTKRPRFGHRGTERNDGQTHNDMKWIPSVCCERIVCKVLVYNIEMLNNNTMSICRKFVDNVDKVHAVTGVMWRQKFTNLCIARFRWLSTTVRRGSGGICDNVRAISNIVSAIGRLQMARATHKIQRTRGIIRQ